MPKELVGYISGVSELHGEISQVKELTGTLSMPERAGDPYTGSYEVIPSDNFQLMPTADCYLEEDILVHPIPYAAVSNEYGGITVTIGE